MTLTATVLTMLAVSAAPADDCSVQLTALEFANVRANGGEFVIASVEGRDEPTTTPAEDANAWAISLAARLPDLPEVAVKGLRRDWESKLDKPYRPSCDWRRAGLSISTAATAQDVRIVALMAPVFSNDGTHAVAQFSVILRPSNGDDQSQRYTCWLERHGDGWRVRRCYDPVVYN